MEQEIQAVESKYKKMLKEAQQEHPDMKRRRHCELQEVERFYSDLKSDALHVVEQTVATDSADDIHKFHMTLKFEFSC